MTSPVKPFSIPIIRRLPEYHAFLEQVVAKGTETISSTTIAEFLNLDPIVVRKDLEHVGALGKPKIGFVVQDLISAISDYMGWERVDELVLVGVGDLGSALMGYAGFAKRGFKIVAAFDQMLSKSGTSVHGIPVFPVSKLVNLVKRLRIEIGIITVPPNAAQEVADLLIEAGIKGIWNFSPAALRVPANVSVQQEDIISSLVILQKNMQKKHAGINKKEE